MASKLIHLGLLTAFFAVFLGCSCMERTLEKSKKIFATPSGSPKGEPAELAPRVGKRP